MLQVALVIIMAYGGNDLYFKVNKPQRCQMCIRDSIQLSHTDSRELSHSSCGGRVESSRRRVSRICS